MLHNVNYIEQPTSSHVTLNSTLIGYRQREETRDREIARLRARMGMVFQVFNPWLHLTALKNVGPGPMKVLR